MELAAQKARPVPTKASRKQEQDQSKGAGARTKPAEVVLTTRAVSLILDSRARIPGKSSARSFISFHCFSSFISFPRTMEPSITQVGSSFINAFSLGFLDRDRLVGTRGLILHISALTSSKEVFSRKGDSAGSGFSFICCLRLLFSCVTYMSRRKLTCWNVTHCWLMFLRRCRNLRGDSRVALLSRYRMHPPPPPVRRPEERCAGMQPSRTSPASPLEPHVLSPHQLLGAAIFLPSPSVRRAIFFLFLKYTIY